jgi:hypothetical protein
MHYLQPGVVEGATLLTTVQRRDSGCHSAANTKLTLLAPQSTSDQISPQTQSEGIIIGVYLLRFSSIVNGIVNLVAP